MPHSASATTTRALGKRRPALARPGVPELGGVLTAVGQVDLEPVDREQPPAARARPRPCRAGSSHGWAAVAVLTITVAGLLTGWAWAWPRSFDRRVTVPLRSWWRFQRIYQRRWRDLMAGCGLLEAHDHIEGMPQIARLRSRRTRDDLLVTLAPGQIPTDLTASAEALAHGLGAWRVTTRPAGPGCLWLLVLWTDPLTRPIHPTDTPDFTDVHDLTGVGVLARLAAVRVGITESGTAWTLPLLPGRHLLVSGTTGSGKQGP